jgi:hypothetical protein
MVIIACGSNATTTAISVGRNLNTRARSTTTIPADGYVTQTVIGVTMNTPVTSGTRCIGRTNTTTAAEDGGRGQAVLIAPMLAA